MLAINVTTNRMRSCAVYEFRRCSLEEHRQECLCHTQEHRQECLCHTQEHRQECLCHTQEHRQEWVIIYFADSLVGG